MAHLWKAQLSRTTKTSIKTPFMLTKIINACLFVSTTSLIYKRRKDGSQPDTALGIVLIWILPVVYREKIHIFCENVFLPHSDWRKICLHLLLLLAPTQLCRQVQFCPSHRLYQVSLWLFHCPCMAQCRQQIRFLLGRTLPYHPKLWPS